MLVQRSVYTLREADPHTWAIPRLTGRAKAALVEIQSDEYGGGRARGGHPHNYAPTPRRLGPGDGDGPHLGPPPADPPAPLHPTAPVRPHPRLPPCARRAL